MRAAFLLIMNLSAVVSIVGGAATGLLYPAHGSAGRILFFLLGLIVGLIASVVWFGLGELAQSVWAQEEKQGEQRQVLDALKKSVEKLEKDVAKSQGFIWDMHTSLNTIKAAVAPETKS